MSIPKRVLLKLEHCQLGKHLLMELPGVLSNREKPGWKNMEKLGADLKIWNGHTSIPTWGGDYP